MIFKLYDCDVGLKIAGVPYEFNHVYQVTIEDPERNRLTRGNNAKNNDGLVYKDGLKDPKRWTMQIAGMTSDFKTLLEDCFKNQTRIECYAISRKDGSSKMAKKAILSNNPQQLSLDDTAESMQVAIEIESFDLSEVHKS